MKALIFRVLMNINLTVYNVFIINSIIMVMNYYCLLQNKQFSKI